MLENRWNKTNIYRPKKYHFFTNDSQKTIFMYIFITRKIFWIHNSKTAESTEVFRRQLVNKGNMKIRKCEFEVYFSLYTRTYASVYTKYLPGFMLQFYLSLTRFTCKHIRLVVILVTKLHQNSKF
jgi:hypothetical protein